MWSNRATRCFDDTTKEGKFIESDTAVFNKGAASEDVDAVFFDANSDGYVDLYVVRGGNELLIMTPRLSDRLYINDGKGHFTEAVEAIPWILKINPVLRLQM